VIYTPTLNLEGSRYESQPTAPGFLWFSSVAPGKCWKSTLTFSVHQSHICETAQIGHLHVKKSKTQRQTL